MHDRADRSIGAQTDEQIDAIDVAMMRRCMELSRLAGRGGEFPFASLIARNGSIISEATNRVIRDGDVTRHAELLAVSIAQRVLGRKKLTGCTLYSNVEPCVMCSFPIREARISRVVFSLKSPLMGGFSRWNVLGDAVISRHMYEVFGNIPQIVEGVLADEVENVWRDWNPLIWALIRRRGCFERPQTQFISASSAPRNGSLRSIWDGLRRRSRIP